MGDIKRKMLAKVLLCLGVMSSTGLAKYDYQYDKYTVDKLDTWTVQLKDDTPEKVVVMLHGGGESNVMWVKMLEEGWFGDMTGLKYVFPTSYLDVPNPKTGEIGLQGLWYIDYKDPNCGEPDDCAYNMTT